MPNIRGRSHFYIFSIFFFFPFSFFVITTLDEAKRSEGERANQRNSIIALVACLLEFQDRRRICQEKGRRKKGVVECLKPLIWLG